MSSEEGHRIHNGQPGQELDEGGAAAIDVTRTVVN